MIELCNATFRTDSRTVLDLTDLQIEPGTLTAILGPSGAGKSTLLDLISGVRRATSGTVRIDGVSVAARAARPEHLRSILGERVPSERNALLRALALLGAGPLAYRPDRTLSCGEKAALDLAHVIAQDARYALLDEPTRHLDLARQYEMLAVFARLASRGAGVVAVLRNVELASLFADRIILMNGGQIVADGIPSVVLQPKFLQRVFAIPCTRTPIFNVARIPRTF